MICTPCGEVLEEGWSTIAGIEREGKLFFVWACVHHPVGDAAIYLGSVACARQWADKHPEYRDEIENIIANCETLC